MRALYRRAFGRDVPHHLDLRALPQALMAHMGPLRFDFEVNRLRGYSLEQGG